MIKNSAEYANNKIKYNVRRALAGVAIVGSAVALAVGTSEGFKAIDEATKHTVDSVTETMPKDGDYISLAKQAVIDLGLDPDNFNETRIGQEVTGDPTPQPGQPVTFDEVEHWYGTTVEGHTVDTDN
jgi:hypothetical protein